MIVASLEVSLDDEADLKIKENMIGDVPWSLKSWVLTNKPGLVIIASYKDYRTLDSISVAYVDRLVSMPGEGLRIGCRLWVSRPSRSGYLPSKHISYGVNHARALKYDYVWTSFNEDREALVRRIQILSKAEDEELKRVWDSWILPDNVS